MNIQNQRFQWMIIALILVSLACALQPTGQTGSQNPSALPTQPASDEQLESTPAAGESMPAEATPTAFEVFVPDVSAGAEVTSTVEASPSSIIVDPFVEISADHTALHPGDTLTVTGKPVQIGMPYYYLVLRDEGVQDIQPVVQITYENQATPMSGSSEVLELVSAEATIDQVTFVLKAKTAGATVITINATGEVQYTSPENTSTMGMGSGSVDITVAP